MPSRKGKALNPQYPASANSSLKAKMRKGTLAPSRIRAVIWRLRLRNRGKYFGALPTNCHPHHCLPFVLTRSGVLDYELGGSVRCLESSADWRWRRKFEEVKKGACLPGVALGQPE